MNPRSLIRVLLLALSLGAAACRAPTPSASPSPAPKVAATMNDTLAETLAIQNLIAEVPHRIDGKHWPELRALYADEVRADYRSLFGGEVQRQSGDVLIDTWRGLLTPVITQHLLGPVVVQINGTGARASCHVRGYHYADQAPGGPEWMVAGHYEFELIRTGAGWKIEQMTLLASYQTGNRQLLQEAQALRRS